MAIPRRKEKPAQKTPATRKPEGIFGRAVDWVRGHVTTPVLNDVHTAVDAAHRDIVVPAEHLYAVGKQDFAKGERLFRNDFSEHGKGRTKNGSGPRFSGYGSAKPGTKPPAKTELPGSASGQSQYGLRDGGSGWEEFKEAALPALFGPVEAQAEANAPWYQSQIANSPHTFVGDLQRFGLGLMEFANGVGPGLRKVADVPTQLVEGLGTGAAGGLLNPAIGYAGPQANWLVKTLANIALNEQAASKDHLGLNPVRPTDLSAESWQQLNKTYPNSRAGAISLIADTMVPGTSGYGPTWRAVAEGMAAKGGVAQDFGELLPGTMASLGDPQAWQNDPGSNTAMLLSLLAGLKGGGAIGDVADADAGGGAAGREGTVGAGGTAGASGSPIDPYIAARRQIAQARAQKASQAVANIGSEPEPAAAVEPPVASAPSGSQYGVAYHMKLDPADWGRSQDVHFNRANAALDAAISSDPEFAANMEELIPGVSNTVSKVNGRDTPAGWTWHHAIEPGVMQLVPRAQHTSGSIFWDTFHPGGLGGYALWARQAGAPQR